VKAIVPGSQLGQDKFAIDTANYKSYIEIGAGGPIKYNNTYKLEQNNWKGFSLDINENRVKSWKVDNIRRNKIYHADAIIFDYLNALQENNLSKRIGYLSCDINPPLNTFTALQRVIEQDIIFDCITFEHDKYQSDIDYDPIVTEYLISKGYKLAVSDVFRYRKHRDINTNQKYIEKNIMETWYVYNDISFKMQTYDEWISN